MGRSQRKQSDFPRFQPYLEKIIDYNRQFIELWGVKETPYDTLLDLYEPGMTVAKLDEVFTELRKKSGSIGIGYSAFFLLPRTVPFCSILLIKQNSVNLAYLFLNKWVMILQRADLIKVHILLLPV